MSWDWLVVLPTAFVFFSLLATYIWLGRTHKRMWGDAPTQETDHKPSPIKTPFWRGGGG